MGTRPDSLLHKDLERFAALLPRGDLWVFGYASLMWAPDFRFAERRTGLVHGFHRSLCVYSHRYRGTPERPGLVMGLCRGGSCWGVAFRVEQRHARRTLRILWDREMPNQVYEPRVVPVRIGRRTIRALTFVADSGHRQFSGRLSVEETARIVAQGCGQRGENRHYLEQTVAHMEELGVPEGHLHEVLGAVRKLCGC
jgi:cation transport protein ChaC